MRKMVGFSILVLGFSGMANADFVCRSKSYTLTVGSDKSVVLESADGEKSEVKVREFSVSPTIPHLYRIGGTARFQAHDGKIFLSTRATLNQKTLFLDYEVTLQKHDEISGGLELVGTAFRDCTPKQKVSFTAQP